MARKKKQHPKKDPEAIYLLELVEENFRRLRFAHVQVEEGGRLLRVSGANKSGKTSLLEGVLALFRGTRQVTPDALNDGSERGRVWARFSNGFQIERRFTQAAHKGYLKIVSADGGKYDQSLIDAWLGGADADPMYLWALDPKKRRELLVSFAGEGLHERLDQLRQRAAELEEQRRPFNSALQRVNRLTPPAFPKPEPVDVAALMGTYQSLQDAVRVRREHQAQLEEAQRDERRARERLEALEEQLNAARFELDAAGSRLSDIQDDVLPADPTDELAQVREQLDQADENRERLGLWLSYEDEVATGEKAAAKAKELTEQRNQLLKERAMLIAGIETDVPGLSFDEEGEPLIYGRPEVSASGAERALFSADVCFAKNPKLKLVLIDEGAALDDDSLSQLAARGKERGFAVLVCTLGREGPGEIVVDDGVALSEGLEEPKEEEPEEPEESEESEAPAEQEGGGEVEY